MKFSLLAVWSDIRKLYVVTFNILLIVCIV